MKLLLHACCGPCLIEPWDALSKEHEVSVVYANPNIHPASEYHRRRDTLAGHVDALGARLIELPYEPSAWIQAVSGLEDDPVRRCAACYRLRLGMTARAAVREGFDAISTTLTVSPYQDPEAIRKAGVTVAVEAGVHYLHTDFRPLYHSAMERSKTLRMYRQRYCGCLFSEIEAEESRERPRKER